MQPVQRALMHTKAALSGPRGPLLMGLIAVLISLPALGLGFMSDDHTLAWELEQGAEPWALFKLAEPELGELRATGAVAWWTSPRFVVSFFRPLASLSHALDFWLWPQAAWLMTLWNVLLYGLCALVVALLYRRLMPSARLASLAALMFVLDEAHAMSVGWISGRNTVLALLGSLTALYCHVRAREEGRRVFLLLGPMAVAFALLSAEAGTWALCLLLAYALVLESGSWSARLGSIAPQLTVGALWTVVYLASGSGVHGTSFYREISAPFHTLTEGVLDLPLSLVSLVGPSMIGLALMTPTQLARLIALPVALFCVWLVWPSRALRQRKDFRFFVAATFACLPPAALAIAQDRTLMGASLGAFGLIALAIDEAASQGGVAARVRRVVLLGTHVFVALPMFVINLGSVRRFEKGSQALVSVIEPGREVVLINSPMELLSDYTFAILGRASRPHAPPLSLHQLYAGGSELWLERVDVRTLDVTATRGWGYVPLERIFCALEELPRAGTEIGVRHLTIRVLSSTPDGRPKRVRFTFPTPLESSERQWLIWRGTSPVALQPPGLGERVRVGPLSVVGALPL